MSRNHDFKPVELVLQTIFSILAEVLILIMCYGFQVSYDTHNIGTYFAIACIAMPIVFLIVGDITIITGHDIELTNGVLFGVFAVICLILGLIALFSSPFTKATEYYSSAASYITVAEDESAFPDLIGENNDTSKLPIIGEDEALKLSETRLAEKTALGSEIEIRRENFMSQNVNNSLLYVNDPEFTTFFRWNRNKYSGVPVFFTVNRNNGETQMYDSSIVYSNSAYFGRNALRHMRKCVGGYIDDVNLEVDNEGKPFYVGSKCHRKWLGGLMEVVAVEVMDPTTGVVTEYPIGSEPDWVDRVYPESVLIDIINYYSQYKDGWINANFAKKDVLKVTSMREDSEGNSYGNYYDVVYINGEAFLYTGLSTAGADGSNNGMVLASLKTGKIKIYNTSGISEIRACEVAEGLVQEKGYKSSYPIILTVQGEPTFLMIMRDSSANVMGYAFVSYKDYTKASYGSNINDALVSYSGSLGKNKLDASATASATQSIDGTISFITNEIIDGRTVYYVVVNEKIFALTSDINLDVVFAKVGDKVTVTYGESSSKAIPASSFNVIK